jgi:uncharacterized metal-binding protein YceD (DUF177 family)
MTATTAAPWSVPIRIDEVPEAGRVLALSADAAVRAAAAKAAGVNAVTRLEATFDLHHHGRDGLHVAGTVEATVRQTCVVTLDPVDNELSEAVDLVFSATVPKSADETVGIVDGDGPEPLANGVVDLGAVAIEFLILAIDPYPRKPGAVFQPPASGDAEAKPFAALEALKKGNGEHSG